MNTDELSALLLLCTTVCFTPGPNNTLVTALAANGGLRHAMRLICAVPIGWATLLALCAAGVGGLLFAVPALRNALQLAGLGYLLWLAWGLARSRHMAGGGLAVPFVGFRRGLALQFLNPKAWLLAMTITTGWIAGRPDAGWRFAQVLPVLLSFTFAANMTYAITGATLRKWLSVGQRLQVFNIAMASGLAITAIWMLVSAFVHQG
jgi:threonine/homoserine/homoserine lactone efflux protein